MNDNVKIHTFFIKFHKYFFPFFLGKTVRKTEEDIFMVFCRENENH